MSACAESVVPNSSRSRDLNDFEQGEIGPDVFRHACLMGLEGIVSKHKDQPYRAGRYKRWIKVKNRTSPAMNGQRGCLDEGAGVRP